MRASVWVCVLIVELVNRQVRTRETHACLYVYQLYLYLLYDCCCCWLLFCVFICLFDHLLGTHKVFLFIFNGCFSYLKFMCLPRACFASILSFQYKVCVCVCVHVLYRGQYRTYIRHTPQCESVALNEIYILSLHENSFRLCDTFSVCSVRVNMRNKVASSRLNEWKTHFK